MERIEELIHNVENYHFGKGFTLMYVIKQPYKDSYLYLDIVYENQHHHAVILEEADGCLEWYLFCYKDNRKLYEMEPTMNGFETILKVIRNFYICKK